MVVLTKKERLKDVVLKERVEDKVKDKENN